ncbi:MULTISPECIES: hypothetical protein [Streptomyces]|uniref:Uncharacterized protein n=2 Tax=Streptomyces rimosus subsp. rimosus TaxID=132474 RepID=L8ERA3_STRR1|nr:MULTISPECIES: hypothetical protein [Streptomyces]KOG83199.1 hypothetical protein ADK78_02745 [Kitasatospora aureofaciens]MYT41015.1 hypothetical protein [Streptomyces sp. SID5471]KEF09265.1 hypothetical protein DF17_02715 [Streptomyces rimosus]KEF19281.1 hypothetical protein DF18_17930 [Streptomyces rimosus]KUJ41985.1 hypothetical protein ADK46_05510 [Streptomyces rimosus subsp. rimosus]
MPEQFTAAQEALHKFAKSSDQRAEKLRAIRSKLASHSLNQQAFGKLPEADELYSAYSEQSEDCLDILEKAATLEEKVGEGVTETARAYQSDEDETVRTMQHVQGGSGSAR